jgi:hypothetical protein
MTDAAPSTVASASAVNNGRNRRQRRLAAAAIYQGLAADIDVTWESLLATPDWCLWPEHTRQQFINLNGALLLIPAMKYWIDGKKLAVARNVLGQEVFAEVMKLEIDVPIFQDTSQQAGDIEHSIISAGISVVVSAAEPSAQELIMALYPEKTAPVPRISATYVQNLAYGIACKLDWLKTSDQSVSGQPNSSYQADAVNPTE